MPTRIVTGNGALRRRRPRAATSADIVERITRAITEHRLPPGTKLTEERLGEVFRVSRTKVRQALFHLAKDKLVDLQTGRGAYVAQPTVRESHEIFDARRLIERGIVARLAGALVPAQLARLRKHLDEEARALASGDVRASTRLSGQFHVLIAEMTGSQRGLGWNLVYFAQYYNSDPPNLWAAILLSGLLGLLAYGAILLAERRALRWQTRTD